jgi:hypothetical protein
MDGFCPKGLVKPMSFVLNTLIVKAKYTYVIKSILPLEIE